MLSPKIASWFTTAKYLTNLLCRHGAINSIAPALMRTTNLLYLAALGLWFTLGLIVSNQAALSNTTKDDVEELALDGTGKTKVFHFF